MRLSGVRADGSSQGGYFILMTDRAALEGELVKYNVLSWRSFKLTRVCRSSLAAEAQSLAAAMDEMMLIRTIISLMLFPGQDPREPTTAQLGKAAAVMDARALYDALQKNGFNSQQDKRTAIEILCIQDELKRQAALSRWVSSEMMLADGLTKSVDHLGAVLLYLDLNEGLLYTLLAVFFVAFLGGWLLRGC